jgi:hypothetical protein
MPPPMWKQPFRWQATLPLAINPPGPRVRKGGEIKNSLSIRGRWYVKISVNGELGY